VRIDGIDGTDPSVQNLCNEEYETAGGFSQPGRAAHVGLSTSF
jgi:outer membrane cobalamin receptor